MVNKWKRKQLNASEAWTEEELANSLGFKFIAGFTEGGAPFGIRIDEDEADSTSGILDTDEELPF
ncbi:MAG TPA: hypothetical protein PKC47_01015 [Petrimonas sp.]|nr:hypothetical protein [Petrimonas sp.]